MKYHIELQAKMPVDIASEEAAAEQRELLSDGEYVQSLLESLDGDSITATLVATGDDTPAFVETEVAEDAPTVD